MSISDQLRADQADQLKKLGAAARVELALDLGRRDVALYAATHAITPEEARSQLQRQRQLGRTPSNCAAQ